MGPATRRGAVLTEFAIAVPVFLLLVLAILETSSAYFFRHTMLNSAREAARSFAINESNASQAAQLAMDSLASIGAQFSVQTSPDGDSGVERWVQISVPMAQATLGDPLNLYAGQTLTVRVAMRREE
jgi:Flp pilus assembly protein TadG